MRKARGVGIIGALRKVYIVVGMQIIVIAFFVSEVLQADVGDHLIGIHIGRGTGASLYKITDELVDIFALDQLVAGKHDGAGFF